MPAAPVCVSRIRSLAEFDESGWILLMMFVLVQMATGGPICSMLESTES